MTIKQWNYLSYLRERLGYPPLSGQELVELDSEEASLMIKELKREWQLEKDASPRSGKEAA